MLEQQREQMGWTFSLSLSLPYPFFVLILNENDLLVTGLFLKLIKINVFSFSAECQRPLCWP